MACEELSKNNPELFDLVANIALDGIAQGMARKGIAPITRSYVGLGPIPVQDCCPDIVAWISNVRPYDATPPDGLVESRILKHWGLAFELNIRVSDCFFEVDPNKPSAIMDADSISKMSSRINGVGLVAYVSTIDALTNSDQMACGTSVTPTAMFPYQEGSCGGFQFSVSIGVL